MGTRGSRSHQGEERGRAGLEEKVCDTAAFRGLPADAQPSLPRPPPLVFSFSLSFPPQLSLILRLPQVEGGCGGGGKRAPGLMWGEGPRAQTAVEEGDPGNPQK